MPRLLNLLLAALAFVGGAAWALLPLDFELVRPRLGLPAVALAGESIHVELRDGAPFDLGAEPTAWLRGQALGGVERVELELLVASRRGARRRLELRLPVDLAAGSYALELELHGRVQRHPKAVHVLEEYPESYKIVQLADLPLFLGDGSGDALMSRIVQEVNLIDPDLVLISGDIAYNGSWDHFYAALEHFEGFEAPLVAGIGNHEYKGLASFFTLLGPLNHIVDLGDRRVITLNSGHGRDQLTMSQYEWVRAAFEQRAGRKTLVQLHHPLFWKRNLGVHVQDLVELCREHEVPIVFTGHWHGDYVFDESGAPRADTWDFEGTKYVVTTAAGADLRAPFSASPLHHGYRLVRLSGNELVNYTYDWDGDGTRHACSSIPVGQISVTQEGPRAVLVRNDLNEVLEDALVPLWIEGMNSGLQPDVGLLAGVDASEGRTRYLVRIDLAANAETLIQLED